MSHIFTSALLAAAVTSIGCGSVTTTESKPDEPTVTAVSPMQGPAIGGATITLTGTHFKGGSATPIVLVGDNAATQVSVASDTSITFMLPPGPAGDLVDVTMSNDNGFATLAQSFTYNIEPVVLSVTPSLAKAAGGTPITIVGRGFMDNAAGTPTITIAGGMATNVQVVDDKTIMATTGAADASTKPFTPVDVTVSNANGSATLTNGIELTKQGLLVIERCCSNRLYYVDPASGTVAIIGKVPQSLHGCATDAGTGTTYAVQKNLSTGIKQLITWDPRSGDTQVIGPLTDASSINHGISALAFDGATLYGFDSQNGVGGSPTFRLMSINTTSGAVTVIGAAAAAVARHNGMSVKDGANLWIADVSSQTLDTIRLSDSTLTTGLAFTGGTAQIVEGLVTAGTKIYLVERNPGNVYAVDQSSGTSAAMTRIATIPTSVTAMCATPPSF